MLYPLSYEGGTSVPGSENRRAWSWRRGYSAVEPIEPPRSWSNTVMPMRAWTKSVVDRGGVALHFHRTGAGDKPPVVLVHGFSDDGLCWTRIAQQLEADFDVVMADARNHGRSGRGPGGPAELAADLAHLVGELALDRPALIGHSVGARTVVDAVGAHPELASRIVLEDPPWRAGETGGTDKGAEKRQQGFLAFLGSMAGMSDDDIIAGGRKTNPEWHEDEFPAWAAAKRLVGPDAVEALVPTDWKAAISKVRCPALLIHGEPERGGMVTPDVAQEIVALNPRFSATQIAGAGHNIRREGFADYVAALRGFLVGG